MTPWLLFTLSRSALAGPPPYAYRSMAAHVRCPEHGICRIVVPPELLAGDPEEVFIVKEHGTPYDDYRGVDYAVVRPATLTAWVLVLQDGGDLTLYGGYELPSSGPHLDPPDAAELLAAPYTWGKVSSPEANPFFYKVERTVGAGATAAPAGEVR